MLKNILDLSKKLISIPSTKDNPGELKRVLDLAIIELGNAYTVEYFTKNNIPSALIYNSKTRPKKFKIILNAHLDVVPAKNEQYQPVIKDGKLFGRGAYDMKAPAACEILAFREMAKTIKYPLALQLVTDEEIGGFDATKFQLDQGIRSDFSIAGESTEFGIKNQAKGIIWAKIRTKGEASHGAYPWQGKNAIWMMNDVLNKLRKHYPEMKKEEWKTTVNIAKIETSNTTYNKVPDDCVLGIDVRYIPAETKTIASKLKKILPKGAEVEILVKEPAQFTPQSNGYIKILRQITTTYTRKSVPLILKPGASDIRHFNRVGCDGVEFGPCGYGLHTDNEWVDIKSLETYYNILKKFLLSVA
ncbi:MAG: peptidase M20 [Candidatus Roizmanbacteria bacterium GW2011_GWA2_36_23]|uniref:Peptidase M20 n=1 Tax=Candidatus Roizmanbacteria bacterium GW2011_GWA2_36_23 TaxID=1618480 RepID=A0A0G0GNW2_9BACT|nr:MAG: peptidase M20 [Candidatus Roizmanbacteria bacterium GW2011_GWA2_36_23]